MVLTILSRQEVSRDLAVLSPGFSPFLSIFVLVWRWSSKYWFYFPFFKRVHGKYSMDGKVWRGVTCWFGCIASQLRGETSGVNRSDVYRIDTTFIKSDHKKKYKLTYIHTHCTQLALHRYSPYWNTVHA